MIPVELFPQKKEVGDEFLRDDSIETRLWYWVSDNGSDLGDLFPYGVWGPFLGGFFQHQNKGYSQVSGTLWIEPFPSRPYLFRSPLTNLQKRHMCPRWPFRSHHDHDIKRSTFSQWFFVVTSHCWLRSYTAQKKQTTGWKMVSMNEVVFPLRLAFSLPTSFPNTIWVAFSSKHCSKKYPGDGLGGGLKHVVYSEDPLRNVPHQGICCNWFGSRKTNRPNRGRSCGFEKSQPWIRWACRDHTDLSDGAIWRTIPVDKKNHSSQLQAFAGEKHPKNFHIVTWRVIPVST